jgi:hypothetical protein
LDVFADKLDARVIFLITAATFLVVIKTGDDTNARSAQAPSQTAGAAEEIE